jgi:hypothetical protein
MQRGARVILLITPPRKNAEPSETETCLIEAANKCGIPAFTLRELLDVGETLEAHYYDDRHPDEAGILPDLTAGRIVSILQSLSPQTPPSVDHAWRWIGVDALIAAGAEPMPYQNRLVDTLSARLAPGAHMPMPRGTRVISVGIVSTMESGALWCGHYPCAPAAGRPEANSFPFLLRAVRVPCVHESLQSLASRPSYCIVPSWLDYGQGPSEQLGPVDIFGILIDQQPSQR